MGKASGLKIFGLLCVCLILFVPFWRAISESNSKQTREETKAPVDVKPVEWKTYSGSAQKEAHKQGKPVLIEFTADW